MCQKKNRIIPRGRENDSGMSAYEKMCHPFMEDLTLNWFKLKCWQLHSRMMINETCMDLCPYLCTIMWRCMVCTCPFLCRPTRFAAVVAALWSVPPTGGPRCAGRVCGGGVIVVSPGSWVLRFEEREKASVGSIHPVVHPSIHIPRPNRKPGAQKKERGGEEERHRKERERERPYK